MMPPTGCNTNGCSLLCVLPTGLLIGSATPQTIGPVMPCTKTNSPWGYSRLLHWEDRFLPGAALARRPTTSTGNELWTKCGRTSAITSRRQPTNAILTRKLLVNARRPIVPNNSLASMPPTNARRPPVVNGFSTRRLHVVNPFSMKRPLVALWPNALLTHNGWWPPEPSSYGFAATASTSGLPARLCGNNNARRSCTFAIRAGLLLACGTCGEAALTGSHSMSKGFGRQGHQATLPQGGRTGESIGRQGQQAMMLRVS